MSLLGSFLGITLLLTAPMANNEEKKNILLFIADDLGIDNVGAYETGNPPPTPNIDKLAREGVVFTQAWSNPVCSPSRASIHTGRHTFRTGIGSIVGPTRPTGLLQPSEITLPELFTGTDYRRALFGKWHLDNSTAGPIWGPIAHGWEFFAGIPTGSLKNYHNWTHWTASTESPVPVGTPTNVYATTKIVNDALDWIVNQEGPWLAFVAFTAPHSPYHAPPNSLHSQKFPKDIPVGGNVPGNMDPTPFYKAMVEAMDAEIGRLLDGIPQKTLANTHIIFLGDNGTPPCVTESPFLPNRAKGTIFEGGVRIPMIISGPAVFRSRIVRAPVQIVDLFLTMAQMGRVAGNIPDSLIHDSRSLMPFLEGKNPFRQYAITDTGNVSFDPCWNGTGQIKQRFAVAIRDEQFKLVRTKGVNPGVIREKFYQLSPTPPFDLQTLPLAGEDYNRLKAELAKLGCPLCQ